MPTRNRPDERCRKSSATLSLFEVMAEEIAAERDSGGDGGGATEAERFGHLRGFRDRFTPTEEVQTALRAWRLEREGVADARRRRRRRSGERRRRRASDGVGEVWGSPADVSPSGVSPTRCSQTRGRVAPTTTPRRPRRRPARYDDDTLDASAAPSAPSAPRLPPLAIRRSARLVRGVGARRAGDLRRAVGTRPRRRGCTVGSPRTGPCCTWARRRPARARGVRRSSSRESSPSAWRRARGSWTRCSPPGARRTRWRSARPVKPR